MSPCRGPRVYSGAEGVFVCKINVVMGVASIIMGIALFLLIKVCFSFDCAWIAPHNNIWADVELSFLKDYLEQKIQNGRHKIKKIIITFSIIERET